MPVPPDPAHQGTPFAFVQAVLKAYAARSCAPDKALAAAQIAPDRHGHWPSQVSPLQFERLCAAAMRELDDEAPGWFSRPLPWGSYGMLARASMGAPTLAVALKRWCRHHGLLTQDIALTLQAEGASATVRLQVHRPLGAFAEFCPVSVLRNIHGLACWFIDSRIALQESFFAFARPTHHDAYAVLFPGPVQFGAACSGLRFDARYLQLPLQRDEAALRQMLQRALPLTVLQYRRDRLLVQRVRTLLTADPAAAHSAEALALRLHLSPRTLHRQLKEEGASLQGLKDEVRRERAMDLLRRTERPIKQVAHEAGFGNDKSFIRAFRGWTGLSPAEFRRQSRASGKLSIQ